jgi:hypothetical protein
MLKNGLEILTIGGVSKKPSGSLDSSQYENSLQFDLKEVQFALDDEDARQQTNGAGYGCSKRDSHDLQHLRGPGYSIRERNMGERRSSHTLRQVEQLRRTIPACTAAGINGRRQDMGRNRSSSGKQ